MRLKPSRLMVSSTSYTTNRIDINPRDQYRIGLMGDETGDVSRWISVKTRSEQKISTIVNE
jgi:hypothetical protein